MSDAPPTPDQQHEAEQLATLFLRIAQREVQVFGELPATRPDGNSSGAPSSISALWFTDSGSPPSKARSTSGKRDCDPPSSGDRHRIDRLPRHG